MKKFHLTNNYVLINFDAIKANQLNDIVSSDFFDILLENFYNKLKLNNDVLIDYLHEITILDIGNFYRLLLVYPFEEAIIKSDNISINDIDNIYNFTEKLYDYWRNLERFGLVKGSKNYNQAYKSYDLLNVTNKFNDLIITLYRTIAEKLSMKSFNVYRQLPAGINANMLYVKHRFTTSSNYDKLMDISFVTKLVINPPFIINSKSNTRSDYFKEISYNPLSKLKISKSHYLSFAIMVGPLLAFVYIHRDFIHHGIGLSNLFEFASYESFKNKKPDLIYVYGISENDYDCQYFYDKHEDIYIGFVSRLDKNDYFGYLKKMLLTLHNVSMIRKGNLPIHGAMVNILLNNNVMKNIVIIGDSGAGKSETLEALRIIGKDYIRNMDIVFDDMGTFLLSYDSLVANGTEIGAFVRLDDLDTGYAYEIMDRALFLNPKQVNARVVIPISSYEFINNNHKVDLLLYANNYDEEKQGIHFFKNKEESLKVFKKGIRKAKGTTSEVGLVESFFANPFGPVQMKNETNILLDKYFNIIDENKIPTGEIYTKLAVDGYESKGPLEAAKLLLEYLIRE